MWGTWPCEPPAWPVAPRPFAVEPIGSWLGRVAARYRMSVDELAQMYDLELDFDRPNNAWLVPLRIEQATVDRLARLARVEADDLNALQWLPIGSAPRTHLAYCPVCIFLNPLDVTSPCWKREWLDASATWCSIHAQPLRRLSITSLRTCSNFDRLLCVISRRERYRLARRY